MKIFSVFSTLSAVLSFVAVVSGQSDPDPIGTIYDGHVPADLYGSSYPYPWPVKLFNAKETKQESKDSDLAARR